LYSSAVYENYFEKYTPAEIMQRPVEDLVLQMKVCRLFQLVEDSVSFMIADFSYFLDRNNRQQSVAYSTC